MTPDRQRLLLELKREAKTERKRVRVERKTHAPVKPDRGRERDNAYLAWLRRQPCRIAWSDHGCAGPVEAAHLRYADLSAGRSNPGLQRKSDDRWATSLCGHHHREQHAHGNERAWWARYGLDGSEVARAQYAQFQAEGASR